MEMQEKKNIKKTALVLGGGGAKGAYQLGAWQALREMGIQIDIVCGTSIGAMNAAMIAQDQFELAEKLWSEITGEFVFGVGEDPAWRDSELGNIDLMGISVKEATAYLKEIFKGGADGEGIRSLLAQYVDEDVIRSSPIDFGITTVELSPFKPHNLFKEDIPEGKLRDFIQASTAIAPAFKPFDIDGILYVDGGYTDVLPVGMAMKKGATDIIAVNLDAVGFKRTDEFAKAKLEADSFTYISPSHDLGLMFAFGKENALNLKRLGYLDTMKAFGMYAGHFYAFPRGEMDRRSMAEAEAAAGIFGLDPKILYSKAVLDDRLAAAVTAHRAESEPASRGGGEAAAQSEPPATADAAHDSSAPARHPITGSQSIADEFKALKTHLPGGKFFRALAYEAAELLGKKVNKKSFVLYIAETMVDSNTKDNLFTNKQMQKLFKNEIAAAKYLVKIKCM